VDGALVGAGSQLGIVLFLCCLLGITPVSSGLWMIFFGLGLSALPSLVLLCKVLFIQPWWGFSNPNKFLSVCTNKKGGKKI